MRGSRARRAPAPARFAPHARQTEGAYTTHGRRRRGPARPRADRYRESAKWLGLEDVFAGEARQVAPTRGRNADAAQRRRDALLTGPQLVLHRFAHHLRDGHATFACTPLGALHELRLGLDHDPLHHGCNHASSGLLPYAVLTNWPCTRLIRLEDARRDAHRQEGTP